MAVRAVAPGRGRRRDHGRTSLARVAAYSLLAAAAGACGTSPVGEPDRPPAPPGSPTRPVTTWIDAGPSFLPNLGVSLGVGRTLNRGSRARRDLELHGIYQFLDDEDFADDGQPKAGPWYQVGGGLRWTFQARGRRHLVTRLGGVWIRAEGRPNVVQEGGDYLGLYATVGFETAFTRRWSIGPELAILGITRTDRLSPARPVPQVNWRARVSLGPEGPGPAGPAPPPRELYGAATGVVSPGLGGGFELGQVFLRSRSAVWSVEVAAAFQPPDGRWLFQGDGQWAQVQAGVRTRTDPDGRGHWTGRGGAVWLRATAENTFLDVPGDHIGAYVGFGYAYDLSSRLSTGPDLDLMLVSWERDVAFRVVPQLRWRVLVGS